MHRNDLIKSANEHLCAAATATNNAAEHDHQIDNFLKYFSIKLIALFSMIERFNFQSSFTLSMLQ